MSPHTPANRFLARWSLLITHFPWLLILITLVLTGVSLHYTINHLGVNTNTAEMLSPDLPFQKNRQRIEAAFPEDAGVIILVVDALTPEETSQAASLLENRLNAQTDRFISAYIPTDNDFFRQQALLFLSLDELEKLADKLTNAQPFIGYLAQHYSLQGLFDIIIKALNQTDQSLPMDLEPLLQALNQTIEQQLNQQPYKVSWQNLLAADKLNTETNRTLVLARPKMNFHAVMPAEQALTSARKIVNQITLAHPGVRIRITGEPALEHEELESVSNGSVIAGIVSLLLVCTSLWLGLRSFKLLLATFIVLILGLILTAGFATISIGHLNLISIAFAVLYIGLGVDYAIHICLHYRECRVQGMKNDQAIMDSIHTVGNSIFLCALTTSLGFLAFIPTDYSGVSELGIISSGGMLIGLVISLTVLPALLTVLSISQFKPLPKSAISSPRLLLFPFHHAGKIRFYSVIFALLSGLLLTQVVFDSNPINLRDPNSESVATIKELLTSQTDSPFMLSVLASDPNNAAQLAQQLEQLSSVHQTIYLDDLVAKNQAEKLDIIEQLDFILGHQLDQFNQQLTNTQPKLALTQFQEKIATLLLNPERLQVSPALLTVLQTNIAHLLTQQDETAFQTLEHNVLDLLPYTMNRLRLALTAVPYQVNDLPDYIRSHWLSAQGQYKILITPEYDQNKLDNLKQFVRQVQSVAPSSSGLPVADQASGAAVVKAFIQAFSGAIIAIFLLLLIILRDFKQSLLVMGPLLLAGLLTGATSVLLNNPFNFANIIALPLLMGMGVDSGIHIMHRLKEKQAQAQDILQSSTARGVFFSSLTTLCSFSSLAFTPHKGTASMGLLLAVGIFFTLFCTLVVLPAFYRKRI